MKDKILKLKNRKNIIRLLFSIIITFFFVYYIINTLDLNDFKNLLANTRLNYILLAFFVYITTYFVRSFRILILLNAKICDFWITFYTVSRYYILNKILPFKIGELSLIYFLKKEHEVPHTKGFALLLYIRLLDVLAVLIFFLGAFIASGILYGFLDIKILIIFFIFFLIIIFIYLFIIRILNIVLKFLKFLLKKIIWLNKKIYLNLLDKYQLTVEEIIRFKKLKTNTAIISLSLTNRLLNSLAMYIIFVGFGLNLSFGNFIIGSTLSIIAESLPISGVGGFGTFEAGWTAGFVLIGYNQKISLLSGFGVNILFFVFAAILTITSFLIFKYQRSKKIKR